MSALAPLPATVDAEVAALIDLLAGRRFVALTGAGCSTESGIPDYRGPETRRRARNPVQFNDFLADPLARRRYWARSAVGWPRFRTARPNPAHHALATLERAGACAGIVTQNVDRLHHLAGSRSVVELHGALAVVRCLACGAKEDRDALQARLEERNPGFVRRSAELAPDGDAELDANALATFVVATCPCGGELKPDVVFFGENVPRPTVDAAFQLLAQADVLLVVGTSLAVFSGFRFVRKAALDGVPVAIVNQGPTRGDPLARLRVDGRAGEVLPAVARALAAPVGCP